MLDGAATDIAGLPGQIPVVEHGDAGLIHQDAAEGGLKLLDGDGTLVVNAHIQPGGGTDGGGAQGNAGDDALAVDGCDGLVGGGEDQLLVGQIPGQGRGAELGSQTVQDLDLILIKGDFRRHIGGIGPGAPLLAPLGEDQAGALLDDGVVDALSAEHGLCGTHEQGVDQSTVAQIAVGNVIFPDILGHHGGQTSHLGGRPWRCRS